MKRRRTLHLETLENRNLLAVFSPLPSADDGATGSLRSAVIAANANGQNDTINLAAGRYKLSLANEGGMQENAAQTGDLDLTEAGSIVTIQGRGTSTIIDAQRIDRIFQVAPHVTLVLRDLVLYAGRAFDDGSAGSSSSTGTLASGGGLLAAADSRVLLTNALVQYCSAEGIWSAGKAAEGGGLSVAGELTVRNSIVRNNKAIARFNSEGPGQFARGGGIAALGEARVVMDESSLTDNIVQGAQEKGQLGAGYGRGGGLYSESDVRLTESLILENVVTSGNRRSELWAAHAAGGGLYVAGELMLDDVRIEENIARGGSGTNSAAGSPGGEAVGGGVFAGRLIGVNVVFPAIKREAGLESMGPEAKAALLAGLAGLPARRPGAECTSSKRRLSPPCNCCIIEPSAATAALAVLPKAAKAALEDTPSLGLAAGVDWGRRERLSYNSTTRSSTETWPWEVEEATEVVR